ncbi:MAG: hypothetical protein ACLUPX_01780 [Atopobiaceae bacterium]
MAGHPVAANPRERSSDVVDGESAREAESRRNFALSVLAGVLAAPSLAVALASWLVG